MLVALAGAALGRRRIERLLAPQPLDAEGAGIAVMVFSILLTGGLVWWQRRVARRPSGGPARRRDSKPGFRSHLEPLPPSSR